MDQDSGPISFSKTITPDHLTSFLRVEHPVQASLRGHLVPQALHQNCISRAEGFRVVDMLISSRTHLEEDAVLVDSDMLASQQASGSVRKRPLADGIAQLFVSPASQKPLEEWHSDNCAKQRLNARYQEDAHRREKHNPLFAITVTATALVGTALFSTHYLWLQYHLKAADDVFQWIAWHCRNCQCKVRL